MTVAILAVAGGVVGGLLYRHGKHTAQAARALLCRHTTMSINTLGAAAFSENGDVELTTQLTCDACKESWIAPLDAGEALRLGMRT